MTESVQGGVDLSVRQMCEAWRVMCRDAPGRYAPISTHTLYMDAALLSDH